MLGSLLKKASLYYNSRKPSVCMYVCMYLYVCVVPEQDSVAACHTRTRASMTLTERGGASQQVSGPRGRVEPVLRARGQPGFSQAGPVAASGTGAGGTFPGAAAGGAQSCPFPPPLSPCFPPLVP